MLADLGAGGIDRSLLPCRQYNLEHFRLRKRPAERDSPVCTWSEIVLLEYLMPNSQVGSSFESFGRKMDEHLNGVAPKIEEEVHKVITYLNDEVVPQVRRNSSEALRTAAEQLGRLAEHLDRNRK
jgi:hypothetical protein